MSAKGVDLPSFPSKWSWWRYGYDGSLTMSLAKL